MNHANYKKWLQEKLIQNLESKSVIVVDNVSSHNVQLNLHPASNARKGELTMLLGSLSYVFIVVCNAGWTMFRGSGRVLATHSNCLFPLHFPSRASPCDITFQTCSTTNHTRTWKEVMRFFYCIASP